MSRVKVAGSFAKALEKCLGGALCPRAWWFLPLAIPAPASAQQLLDAFDRPNATLVGGGWTEVETDAPGSIAIQGRMLRMSSGTAGRDFVWRNAGALYNTTLGANTCTLSWAFNVRQSRSDPSGFNATNYGAAFVLGGSSEDFLTGQGYAVVLGGPGSPDPLRLVRYDGGLLLNSNLTDILTTAGGFGSSFLSVFVTCDPATGTWTLYHASSPTSFADPVLASTFGGAGVDNTFTGIALPYVGCFWNHDTSAGEAALFDNVRVPRDCGALPTANLLVPSITVPESMGAFDIGLHVSPAPATDQTLTISLSPGSATYGDDYTTVPDGGPGSITLDIPAGTSLVYFPMTVIDDAVPEPTETVTLTITGTSAGLAIGARTTTVVRIGDNDHPPTALGLGDLVIVGVNADNGPLCTGVPDDRVSFFCLKDITAGTTIDLTDNGYGNCTPGFWSDNEGIVRMTRTGPTIPAGTVITWRIRGAAGPQNVAGTAPDPYWTCASLSAGVNNVALAAAMGDQFVFLQGGVWNDPAGAHNATYTGGRYLNAYTTKGTWDPVCDNNSSLLPPELACLPRAPDAAGNWRKYTGDIVVPRTALEWLVEVAQPGNWASGTDCGNYNGLPNDWESAPVLPILPGVAGPGTWTGAVSTDWFDCRNWSDLDVPDPLTDVAVAGSALRDCEVGPSTPGIAQCSSLLVSSGAAGRTLTVGSGGTLNAGGPLFVQKAQPGGTSLVLLENGGTLSCQSLLLQGTAAGTLDAVLRNEDPANTVQVEAGLTIAAGGALDLEGIGQGGVLDLGGNFTNQDSDAAFSEVFSTVVFNDNGAQRIITPGFRASFWNLVTDKVGGDLVLDGPAAVGGALDLRFGRVFTDATNVLTLLNSATVAGGSDVAFVHGPMEKQGLEDFTFPIGKNDKMRPCGLSGITGAPTDAFIAEYVPASPQTAFNNVREPALDHISDCEYWTIARSAGNADAVVELTWETPWSCGVTEVPNLRVARWDGATWLDRGNGLATGDVVAGRIATAAPQTLFSPWTLASANGENPLPVTLVSFTARPEHGAVRLEWTTASERDNDFFTVERSGDGVRFHALSRVPGAGNSQRPLHYTDLDRAPLPGINYYRLRQTDFDGTTTLSPVVAVRTGPGALPLQVVLDGGGHTVLHGFPPGSRYELLDMTGRAIASGSVVQEQVFPLPAHGLRPGAYLLRMADGQRMESTRFLY